MCGLFFKRKRAGKGNPGKKKFRKKPWETNIFRDILDERKGVRKKAVDSVKSKNLLVRLVAKSEFKDVRERAFDRLTGDIPSLTKIYRIGRDSMEDDSFIDDALWYLSEYVEKVEDRGILLEIAKRAPNKRRALSALEKLENLNDITDVAMFSWNKKVRRAAFDLISDNPTMLMKIIDDIETMCTEIREDSVRILANNHVDKIYDPTILFIIAEECEESSEGLRAVKQLKRMTDPEKGFPKKLITEAMDSLEEIHRYHPDSIVSGYAGKCLRETSFSEREKHQENKVKKMPASFNILEFPKNPFEKKNRGL